MSRIDIEEAKAHFAELMARVANGEEVIIEQDNQPVAKLSPLPQNSGPRQPGSAKGSNSHSR